MPYKSKIHSEQSIQAALYKYFREKKMKYMLSSVYIYNWALAKKRAKGDRWEDDFFFVDPTFMKWSIEIKRDRQDFTRSEAKKTRKHDLLMEAYETNNKAKYFLPNFFYYCAPTGMIGLDEIPPYAGLIEVDDDHKLTFTSEQKQVHNYSDKERLMEKLLDRFYKKSFSDEQLYINFIQEWRNAGDSLDRRNTAVMRFERKKRIG